MATTASLLLPACDGAHTRALSWWAIGKTGENAPTLLPAFERETGIAVDIQTVPWTGAHEKLLTSFAGDSLPDVMMVNSAWLPELALIGALSPPPPRSPLLTGQFAGALASVTVNGRAVAIPWTADSWVQFYRRDLIEEVGHASPPLIWDQWLAMARAIKRRHAERYATLHLLDWPEPLFALASQTGEPLLRDSGTRGDFSSPGFRAALAFYKTIFDEQLSPAITGSEAGDNYINWHSGLFAIFPTDSVTIGDLRTHTAMFPIGSVGAVGTPGPAGAGRAVARSAALAVSHAARDPERAWRLVAYLTGAPLQRRLYTITGDLPTRPAAWNGAALTGDPIAQLFARQIADGVAPPAVPEWERITTEVQLVAEHMVRGEYGVDQATIEMDARVDRILEKRRWMLDRGMLGRSRAA